MAVDVGEADGSGDGRGVAGISATVSALDLAMAAGAGGTETAPAHPTALPARISMKVRTRMRRVCG
ncbi:MAG: hypothetical protein D6791_15200 [Chloroflexi bacterium]|nr:MAG: hypothetical protein D6791_15200 [Chloroflexota bacterium]